MTLFSGNPVRLKNKRTPKLIERSYYIDITKALDPEIKRATTIFSVHQHRIRASNENTIPLKTMKVGYFRSHRFFNMLSGGKDIQSFGSTILRNWT